MAKVIPMKDINNSLYAGKGYHSKCGYSGGAYGDLNIPIPFLGPVKLPGPTLLRVSAAGFPDFTIDLEAKGKPSTILGIMNPKITLLTAGNALEYEHKTGKIKSVDPKVFNKPTLLDRVQSAGPTAVYGVFLAGLVGVYLAVKLIRGRKS